MLGQHASLSATDPEFRAAVEDVINRVGAVDAIAKVESPFAEENTGQISADQHSVLVDMEIAGESDDAVAKIAPVVDRVQEVQGAHPSFYIGSVGVSTEKDDFADWDEAELYDWLRDQFLKGGANIDLGNALRRLLGDEEE